MVKIRLSRIGAKGQPYYRVVVVDERKKRDGKVLEIIGRYNPRTEPSSFEIDQVRLKYWRGVGAQLTEPVQVLLGESKPKKHAEKNAQPEKPAVAEAAVSQDKAPELPLEAQGEVQADAPETTPDASPELAQAVAASEEASVPASAEVVAQTVENADEIATSQVAENNQPTTQEEKVSEAELVQETASDIEGDAAQRASAEPTL